jgi:cbb3-type cytochrome oxidase subunit 3
MTPASYIFWAIFVLPLIVFLVWVLRQDKRKGKFGLIVLAVIVIGVIVYMYWHNMFTASGGTPALQ